MELLDGTGNNLKVLGMPQGFRNVKYVYLSKNQLEDLPECFAGMRELEMLFLSGNPLKSIPPEVVGNGESHNSAIEVLAYLQSVQGKKTRYLHEAKMILIGNPMVGKSSIRLKLNDPKAELPQKKDRTLGLDLGVYQLKKLPCELTKVEEPIDFQLNIWDFGGQGRYREIQQLFCSRKSLYLYVTSYDDQPEKEDYIGLDYWLSMVNAYSFDPEAKSASPVIYILNKVDIQDEGINEKSARERFPNLSKFVKISCEKYTGFEQLIEHLRQILPLISIDIFNNRYSQDWFRVKERLASLKTNHLNYEAYLEICHQESLELNHAKTWLTVLDRIGSVIYTGDFQDPQEWIILNPNWVKDVICKVIDSPLMQRDGILRAAYFDSIWPDYPDSTDRVNLVKLMLDDKYKLAYAIPSNEGETDYMVPSALFNKAKPSFAKFPHLEKPANFNFQFRFTPFIPAGIVNKLVVTLHPYIYNSLIWGNGCVLHDGISNTFIIFKEDWEKHWVAIEIRGEQPQLFYQTLVNALQQITEELKNAKFIHHLSFDIWMEYEDSFHDLETLKKFGKFPLQFIGTEAEDFTKFQQSKLDSKEYTFMNDIKQLIASGRLKDALQALISRLSGSAQNEAMALNSRLTELDRKTRLNIIDERDAGIERSKLVSSALELCDQATSIVTQPGTGSGGTPIPKSTAPKKLFFSYSKYDVDYVKQLSTHLAALRRKGKIEQWDDSKIKPGEEWDDTIKNELAEADIILLFISADFLNTEYIWDVEIKGAMERHERKEARVIPIFIRPCDWSDLPFSKLNGLPSKATPVDDFPSRDKAWLEVVKGIESVL